MTLKNRAPRASASLLSFAALLLGSATCPAASDTWQDRVSSIIGWKGQNMPDEVLRFTLVPSLRSSIANKNVWPNLALDGYAAFHAEGSRALVVAEIATVQSRVDAVVDAATAAGLHVSAVHNHLVDESPRIMFVHMSAYGDPLALARGVRAALRATGVDVHRDDDAEDADDVAPGLDRKALEAILKSDGTPIDGVLEFSFDRPETFTLDGHALPSAMGPESEVHFQSLRNGGAVEVAEIALLQPEVEKALRVLKASGQHVSVSALHNHFTDESPRLFFLHTWGMGDADSLARTIRQVLNQTPQ